ncbi:MAG: N-acetyltransferase [Streptomyces oryziradicis]|nr:N-acetyltransferase [Actinacidiphila oryziradicis]
MQVRPAGEDDLADLTEIYNHYVRETPITFDLEPLTPQQRRPWLLSHPEDGPHRLLVACGGPGGRILGYATSSPFRPKAAYATSVETSVYCAPDAGGRGTGTLLYKALFEALREEDVHRAYAGIAQPNEASVRLHARFGFQPVGVYREVGRKFGRYWDVAWYEKDLSPGTGPAPAVRSASAPAPGRIAENAPARSAGS